jgi:hypothetical protein
MSLSKSVNPESRFTINAPVALVWQVLSDFEAYPQWNPCVRFRGRPVVGAKVPITLQLMGRSFPFSVRVETMDEQRELRWRGGPRGLMTGTHYFKIRALTDGTTEMVHGERFEGLAVSLTWPAVGRAFETFYERINQALLARCDQLVQG